MLRFGSIVLASLYCFLIKICGLFVNFINRSKSSGVEENGLYVSGNRSHDGPNSVVLQSGLISNSSKCQVMCGGNVGGFLEEPKTVKFVVQEMFAGSDDVLVMSDHGSNLGCEISQKQDPSEFLSFHFDLFNGSFSTNDDQNLDEEREEGDSLTPLSSEEIHRERENFQSTGVDLDHVGDGQTPEEQDISYEVEFLSDISSTVEESDNVEGNDSGNWMSDFLDETDVVTTQEHHDLSESVEDLDDHEYIELGNLSLGLTHVHKESSSSFHDSNKVEQLQEQSIMQSKATNWGSESGSGDDEDEPDVLSEHQQLVQQMKMELKNCRIRGLPTISEECESLKIIEDLKPLEIDHKLDYKHIMEEIHKFYKSYSDKMRKLDILNYQTLHAISFLQLKDSEVFTVGKKKIDRKPAILPNIWPRKVQRIHADHLHKSSTEMHRDLELVYVGQLCLSWEILHWLYLRARELLVYDRDGNHSYNRAAEEFQQFQVLMQRFMEDEPFQGRRNPSYVKSRCMIRSLLQVPMIKDDCLKMKKERREESDIVSLEMLVEIIRESMLVYRDFLFADKKSFAKFDVVSSEVLSDTISNLHKKERRMREHMRSRNCIVKRLKKEQECRFDREILACQVELRLVARVVSMSRLTADQLVWCNNKLHNISFVGRKVYIEPSFLLFPC